MLLSSACATLQGKETYYRVVVMSTMCKTLLVRGDNSSSMDLMDCLGLTLMMMISAHDAGAAIIRSICTV